jgi:hypothetical protein
MPDLPNSLSTLSEPTNSTKAELILDLYSGKFDPHNQSANAYQPVAEVISRLWRWTDLGNVSTQRLCAQWFVFLSIVHQKRDPELQKHQHCIRREALPTPGESLCPAIGG